MFQLSLFGVTCLAVVAWFCCLDQHDSVYVSGTTKKKKYFYIYNKTKKERKKKHTTEKKTKRTRRMAAKGTRSWCPRNNIAILSLRDGDRQSPLAFLPPYCLHDHAHLLVYKLGHGPRACRTLYLANGHTQRMHSKTVWRKVVFSPKRIINMIGLVR